MPYKVWFRSGAVVAAFLFTAGAASPVVPGGFRYLVRQLQRGTGPTFLVEGPDGDLWFSNVGSNSIARFEIATQQLRAYRLPRPNSHVLVMAPGPDGNVWYSDGNYFAIGSIAPNGRITEFNLPRNVAAAGLAAGPDGNMWLTGGPDDALWFTEYFGGRIGRITTDGQISEYVTSSRGTFPMHIVVGSDGDLWFTEVGGNALGRITMGGRLTEFPFAGHSASPDGIALGADNRIWFTQYQANRLGVVLSP